MAAELRSGLGKVQRWWDTGTGSEGQRQFALANGGSTSGASNASSASSDATGGGQAAAQFPDLTEMETRALRNHFRQAQRMS